MTNLLCVGTVQLSHQASELHRPMEATAVTGVPDNGTNSTCVNTYSDALSYIIYSLLGLAIVTFVLYCFLQKRKQCGRDVCCGVPSVIVPVDLIHSSPHRIVYVFIFGAISGHILFIILQDDLMFTQEAVSSVAGSTASSIGVSIFAALLYFPLFASVRAPIPLLGYFLGLLYSLLTFSQFFVQFILISIACVPAGQGAVNFILGLVAFAPVLLCQLLVVLWFIWRIVKEFYRLCRHRTTPLLTAIFEHEESSYHTTRVKWLLTVPERIKENVVDGGKYDAFKRVVIDSLFKWNPHIQYPLRFLSAMIIMVNIVYVLLFAFIGVFIEVIAPALQSVSDFGDQVDTLAELLAKEETFGTNISSFITSTYSVVDDAAVTLLVILPLGPIVAWITCMILLVHMVAQIHIHIRKLSKGSLAFVHTLVASPAYRLVHAMVYPGYQAAFFIWAWILLTIVLWIAGLAILVFYYLFKFAPQQTGYTLISLAVPLLYSFGIYYLQVILAKLFFVGDTKNRHTVITNLRWYHFLTYLLYFQNIVVGITSALLRVLYSVAFGLLLLFRLDRVVLMKGFERYDSGHRKYIGFLYLEYSLNNAVLNVFCEELLKVVAKDDVVSTPTKKHSIPNSGDDEKLVETERPRVSKRAMNRWLVAYTLVQNESLQCLTATRLKQRSEETSSRHTRSDGYSPIPASEQENLTLVDANEGSQVLASAEVESKLTLEPDSAEVGSTTEQVVEFESEEGKHSLVGADEDGKVLASAEVESITEQVVEFELVVSEEDDQTLVGADEDGQVLASAAKESTPEQVVEFELSNKGDTESIDTRINKSDPDTMF